MLAFLGLPEPRRYGPGFGIVLRTTAENGSQLLCFEWNVFPPKNLFGSYTFVIVLLVWRLVMPGVVDEAVAEKDCIVRRIDSAVRFL